MTYKNFLVATTTVVISFLWVEGVELTFELPDNEKQCFYENIPLNKNATLKFQVVTGGQYDVDVSLEAPNKEIIYKENKIQFGAHTFTPKTAGVYAVCFSNEFSTFSHKTVYMNFHVGEEPYFLQEGKEHITSLIQMESSALEIHKHLSTVNDYQTYHRLKEAKGRKRAEGLNSQVLWWSVLEIIVILLSAIGQVLVVIRDFSKTTIQINKT